MTGLLELEKHLIEALTFPKEVHLESSSFCNSRCVMCPRDKMQREIGFLDAKLFDKAVKETVGYELDYLHLHLNGEPMFLEITELVRRINFARDINPQIKQVCMFTNGSLLTPECADALLRSKLDVIMISVNAGCKEDYEKIMRGLKWDVLMGNIQYLVRRKKELKSSLWIQTGIIPTTENVKSVRLYFKIFGEMGVSHVGGGGINNIGGLIDAKSKRLSTQYTKGDINAPCSRLFLDLGIMSDGRACVCSQDVTGALPVGDLRKETIKEIWQGKKMAVLRHMFVWDRKKEIPFCGECDYMEGCVTPSYWRAPLNQWRKVYEKAKSRAMGD